MFLNQLSNNIYCFLFLFFGNRLKYDVIPRSCHHSKEHKGSLMSYSFTFARLLLFCKGLNKTIHTHVIIKSKNFIPVHSICFDKNSELKLWLSLKINVRQDQYFMCKK